MLGPHIDLDELRSFVEVGASLSFVHAAERLGISASTATRRVQRLEKALGVALLIRSTREVALSAAGQRFLPRAKQVLATLSAAVQDLEDSERVRSLHLTLASLPTVTGNLLPEIIRRFRIRWPHIFLRVIECGAREVLGRVRDGTADFGFTFEDPHSRTGEHWPQLAFQKVVDDPYCLIVPAAHPLAESEDVRWRDLKPYATIAAGPNSGNMKLLRSKLQGLDWLSDTVYEIDHLTTSLGMVEAGLGIAVVPLSSVPIGKPGGVVMRPLTEPSVHRTLGLFRRRDQALGDAARQFLAIAQAVPHISPRLE